MTTANGMAVTTVSAKTPASTHGARPTRFQPSSHAAMTCVMSGEEAVAQHQLLKPEHPGQCPLRPGFRGGRCERAGIVRVVHVEDEHPSRIDHRRGGARGPLVLEDGAAVAAVPVFRGLGTILEAGDDVHREDGLPMTANDDGGAVPAG